MGEFIFETKARTLKKLEGKVDQVIVLDQFFFTVQDWRRDKKSILINIQNQFRPHRKIVVRSSAVGEDSLESSAAGQFESVLGVDVDAEKSIHNAIELVKDSYVRGAGDVDIDKHEILVQPHVGSVKMSGVMFTTDVNTGAPYIVIHYDDYSGTTDYITSGNSGACKVFTFNKNSSVLPTNQYLASLVKMALTLEKITQNQALDIEFAINDLGIHLLQVRPITTLRFVDDFEKSALDEAIKISKEFFNSTNRASTNLYGYRAIYGIMPDWNPAEIIGVNPRPLAFSLYRELITDEIWPLSRKLMGYRDIGCQPGIVSFSGKPYVDVRMSFNTFLPETLSPQTSEKLMNFYLDKLATHLELHDKVEFKIVHSVYHFDFEPVCKELSEHQFSKVQIEEIEKSLIKLTNDIVSEKIIDLDQELALCEKMDNKREAIESSKDTLDVKIHQLISDCKFLGTLPFSKLARCGFVANVLLRSLENKGILTEEDRNRFFKSVDTVAMDFVFDLDKLKRKEFSKVDFWLSMAICGREPMTLHLLLMLKISIII